MARIANLTRVGGMDLIPAGPRLASGSVLSSPRNLDFGPILLAATIVLLPLQDHVPSLAGFSIIYVIFGVVGVYVLFNRRGDLARVSTHPVFLAAYLFLCVGLFVESVHANSDYSELLRYGYMIAGAVLVASLSTSRSALRAGLYGYLISSFWLSVFLFWTSYGALQRSSAADFEEASNLRTAVFSDQSLKVNLNTMAFISSQGVVVALALMLTAKSRFWRLLFMAVALFCFVASFIPMSRSGTVIAVVSAGLVIYKCKTHRLRAVLAGLVLAIGISILVPDSVLSRLHYSTEAREGKMEGRARVYTAAWRNLPEYLGAGVGTGNYFREWANTHGLGFSGKVSGAHNCFFQVTIYWGVAGLLTLLGIIWYAYRCLPGPNRDVGLTLFLYGISLSLLLWMMVTHNLYGKEFSLGLGLLVGARLSDARRRKIPGTMVSRKIRSIVRNGAVRRRQLDSKLLVG